MYEEFFFTFFKTGFISSLLYYQTRARDTFAQTYTVPLMINKLKVIQGCLQDIWFTNSWAFESNRQCLYCFRFNSEQTRHVSGRPNSNAYNFIRVWQLLMPLELTQRLSMHDGFFILQVNPEVFPHERTYSFPPRGPRRTTKNTLQIYVHSDHDGHCCPQQFVYLLSSVLHSFPSENTIHISNH